MIIDCVICIEYVYLKTYSIDAWTVFLCFLGTVWDLGLLGIGYRWGMYCVFPGFSKIFRALRHRGAVARSTLCRLICLCPAQCAHL